MGVALISWGCFFDKHGNKITVPAPSTTPGVPWYWDFLAKEASALRRVGFTAVQLPPASKAQGGAQPGCDGYGVFDPRDLGSKMQQGSLQTRYGSVESLRRLVACCHAVGLDVYLDVVLHQLSGENGGPGVFNYLGANGKTLNGRGPMQPGCFRGVPPANRPEDAVPVPADDFQFGREKVYQNCIPHDYTISDALDYGDWLFRATDADGMRCDDTKGTWAPFVSNFMRSRTMSRKFAFSEYFEGNPANLNGWATNPPMSSRSLVVDFPLHFAMQAACNGLNAAVLNGAGYCAQNPFLACTFVENPDTDTSNGEAIISCKLLAYAFMLSIEGYPFVYAKDYFPASVLPGSRGLKQWIDNLVWIHETLASGNTVTQHVDEKVIVVNRTGGPGLLTALNFDTFNRRTITCPTAFGGNVNLHDYTGHHADIFTDGGGNATFTIPSNAFENGQSYLCFSRASIGNAIQLLKRPTTQVFFGAADLDIPPAADGQMAPGRIWCDGGTTVSANLTPNPGRETLNPQAQITFEVMNPAGNPIGTQKWTHPGGTKPVELKAHTSASGWHTLRLTSRNLPAAGIPFELEVTYTATQELAL
jgi:alpha-amylase